MQAVGSPLVAQVNTPSQAPRASQAQAQPPAGGGDSVHLSGGQDERRFKLSGLVLSNDLVHAAQTDPSKVIAPIKVPIPGGHFVPQYSPTVVGAKNEYDPAHDCDGNFMSYKFAANNNCYNYATNVATNSFAQPGRKHGLLFGADNFTGDNVIKGAEMDGLIEVADHPLSNDEMAAAQKSLPPGHFVALLFSDPDPSVSWPGDYHWARRDDNGTWSQKDGTDQVTNFDFAGNPISDAGKANWSVNQGPISDSNPNEAVVSYHYIATMYVPDGKIDII